jgi:hypothetical protein
METDNGINTVADFIKCIFEKISTFERDVNDQIFWFRGESSKDFKTPLVPSINRIPVEDIKAHKIKIKEDIYLKRLQLAENNIAADFYRKAHPYIASKRIDNTPWNRYFLMQHYKIKTRLLDWTENCLLALFFALSDTVAKNDDAKIWILKPFELNNRSIQLILKSENECKEIPTIGRIQESGGIFNKNGDFRFDELTRRYFMMDFEPREGEDISATYYPLSIYPTYLDQRMSAQRTCFTIFGNKIDGLLSLPIGKRKVFDFIIIPNKSKEPILNELKLLGIDYSSIYPDLDGLGNSINEEFKNQMNINLDSMLRRNEND